MTRAGPDPLASALRVPLSQGLASSRGPSPPRRPLPGPRPQPRGGLLGEAGEEDDGKPDRPQVWVSCSQSGVRSTAFTVSCSRDTGTAFDPVLAAGVPREQPQGWGRRRAGCAPRAPVAGRAPGGRAGLALTAQTETPAGSWLSHAGFGDGGRGPAGPTRGRDPNGNSPLPSRCPRLLRRPALRHATLKTPAGSRGPRRVKYSRYLLSTS